MREALRNGRRNWHLKGWDGDVSGCHVETESSRASKSFILALCPQGKNLFLQAHIINPLTTKGLNERPYTMSTSLIKSRDDIILYVWIEARFHMSTYVKKKINYKKWWKLHLHPRMLIMLFTWTQIVNIIKAPYSFQKCTRRVSS